LTPEQIRARSVLRIETSLGKRTRASKGEGGVSDARLAARFGHVEFVWPVPNGAFLKGRPGDQSILRTLQSICIVCARPLHPEKRTCEEKKGTVEAYDPEDPAPQSRPRCGPAVEQPNWILFDGLFLRAVFAGPTTMAITPTYVDQLLARAGQPHLMWHAFPVPPLSLRASSSEAKQPKKKVDDFTVQLRAIVRSSLRVREHPTEPSLVMYLRDDRLIYDWDLRRPHKYAPPPLAAYDVLCRDVARYQNNRLGVRSELQYGALRESIACRFRGNGVQPKAKFGRLRGTVLSKRQMWVARLVIAILPLEFEVWDVGVPAWVAERLRIKEGDWVLLNRAPTLHRASLLGHRVRIFPDEKGDVLRIHMAVTMGYNADFDGDEMHIYVPQSDEAKREARELVCVWRHMVCDGEACVGFTQNAVMSAYLSSGLDDTWLPPELTLTHDQLVVVNGKVIAGHWTKALLNGSLLPAVIRLRGQEEAARWLGTAYRYLADRWLPPLSVTLRSLRETAASLRHAGGGVVPDRRECGLHVAIESGAKGSGKNRTQILVEIGQQQDWTGAPMPAGHINEGFLQGMKPFQHFLHLAAARSALVDTAVHTADTGYLQRCITMALEGLVQRPDGTIWDHSVYPIRQLEGEGLPAGTGAWEMVGHHAAMAIMAKLTQANLRAFHNAGTAGAVKLGTKHLRAFLRPNFANNKFVRRLFKEANGQIEGVRALLVAGIQAVTEGMGVQVPAPYLWLLVRRMTWDGEVRGCSYHRIGREFGPLKQAAFEQPLQTLLQAAQKRTTDYCTGPTEACIFSRRFDPTDPQTSQSGFSGNSLTYMSPCLQPHRSEYPNLGLWGDLSTVPQPQVSSPPHFSHTYVELDGDAGLAYDPESPAYVPMSPSYRPTSPEPLEPLGTL
ncbi:MAG: hypothetical protein IPO08_23950, partial [Xanthomonadales bacterium]|nr:hypothetical protein [Xanthomonadales bacterium]